MKGSADDLIAELVRVCENPLSSKAEIMMVVRRLARVPQLRAKVLPGHPMREEMLTILNSCTQDDDRGIYFNGEPVTAKLMCDALGRKPDMPTLTRIGKMMIELGYGRIQRTRTHGSFYRAPKPLGDEE